jgi:hypothetical protein
MTEDAAMARELGSRTWFFPDGDLPPAGDAEPKGHESLIILNPGETDAEVRITVYFEDRDPVALAPQRVGARRVRCLRTSEPIDGYSIPPGQYALRLDSSAPIVCQLGRMDVRQPNLAYYTVIGHPID